METEWGKEFVATWEQIYNIGGLAIAVISAPQLIQSALSSGARIIHSATGATRTFIKQVLVSIILQKNIAKVSSSTLKSVEVGIEVLKKAKINFSTTAASRLEEKGVVFVRLVDDAGLERYSAVYKGEVIVPNGSSEELRKSLDGAWNKTGDDLVKELNNLEDFAIQRKIEERARAFIHKWNQNSASLMNMTVKEMSVAIKGYVPEIDEIAEAIEKGGITVNILADEKYFNILIEYAKKVLKKNNEEAIYYAWTTEAFTINKKTYFKESTRSEKFLTQLVHEGTHALDNLNAENWLKQGETEKIVKAKIGNIWDKEDRAFINEWKFQTKIKMSPEFKSIEDIKEHVRKNYKIK